MATTVGVVAADVCSAIASTPTRIARAGASIVGVVVIGVAMVAAMATMAAGRRRRIPASAWTALGSEGRIQVGSRGGSSLTLHKFSSSVGGVSCCDIVVFAISGHQGSQLLAHLLQSVIVFHIGASLNTFEQLGLEVGAQRRVIIFRCARSCELSDHVLIGGGTVLLRIDKDAKTAETIRTDSLNHGILFGMLLCLELQQRHCFIGSRCNHEARREEKTSHHVVCSNGDV